MTTWKIVQLDRNAEDGFVTTAHWRCDALETTTEDANDPLSGGEIFSASAYGSVGVSGELTTPYEELTEAQVLEWVWGQIDKAEVESNLTAQINAQKNPVSATGVPW